MRLVQYGSRFLKDTKTRYPTIELKLLAVALATSKCRLYLFGLAHLILMTDHRPLIPLLNTYTLQVVENPLLQRLKVKVSPYIFTAEWRAGKQFCIPDVLSRAPVFRSIPENKTDSKVAAVSVHHMVIWWMSHGLSLTPTGFYRSSAKQREKILPMDSFFPVCLLASLQTVTTSTPLSFRTGNYGTASTPVVVKL